jgi:hypothetical protein
VFPGTTEEQARFFFRSIDLDRNGHIDFDEFTRFVDRQTHCGHGEGIGLGTPHTTRHTRHDTRHTTHTTHALTHIRTRR